MKKLNYEQLSQIQGGATQATVVKQNVRSSGGYTTVTVQSPKKKKPSKNPFKNPSRYL